MHAYPHGHVFYRRLTKSFPRIVRGEGCWLEDANGQRYLDAVGGAFVASLGHGDSEIAEAMAAQARRVAYVNGPTRCCAVLDGPGRGGRSSRSAWCPTS
jgi:adenosylmethionine-8-amino-7-oxononanoate aminotransferase